MAPDRRFDRPATFLDVVPDFCATILQTLVDGWTVASRDARMRAGSPEVRVTEMLRKGMREVVNARTGDVPRMIVLPGTESFSQSAVLGPDGLTDIPICFPDVVEACLDHDPHAIIECKRVAGSDRALCRLYVTEGIDRFVTGKYSGGHAIAFMCGYLQSGDVELAVVGINRYLSLKNRSGEHVMSSTILQEKWARTSHHSRSRGLGDIDVHHAFFEFNWVP